METSVYVASAEGHSGKSAVALGLLEHLTKRYARVGVYRPVTEGVPEDDTVLATVLAHASVPLSPAEAVGVSYEDVHHDADAALGRIVERFHEVQARCDVVVILGSDFTDVTSPTEFSFNARVAANLAAPVLLVVGAHGLPAADVATVVEMALGELRSNVATPLAVVLNRADPGTADGLRHAVETVPALDGLPTYVIPASPLLSAPTVRDLLQATDGVLISGDEALLDREALAFVTAAMTMPNVLDRLLEESLVLTPGDRADVLLSVLLAHQSSTFPTIAGVMLNGGFELPPQVRRLIDGLGSRLPIITTHGGTHDTVMRLAEVRGRMTPTASRKIATAVQLFTEHVDADALLAHLAVPAPSIVTPLMFEHQLLEQAKAADRHIVLPEGQDDRILRATEILLRRGTVRITLLGVADELQARAREIGVDLSGAQIIDPHDPDHVERFAARYAELRAHKGMTVERAREVVVDPSYFGTMMVLMGEADGMVSGAVNTTAHTIRPALEVVKTNPGVSVVSSSFLMCLKDHVTVYGDCAVNPDPDAEQLADIAISSAQTAAAFGVEPRVAMLSYSTGTSGSGADVDKVRQATEIVRRRAPELLVEGPIQFDAAVDPTVGQQKAPGSPVAGHATVLIFPDLNTGNNTYKAVQRTAGAVAIGPVLQGLRKPVNDLSRGATLRDIVNTVAITAIQSTLPAPTAQPGDAH
ncbi:phosphate acetyltransferase [Arsenicicoccus sp. oral taxon 190]|uniref:phosphate acetyltransferase n=1 Tax=Arsenicicoccus sp. oral taxon 190 TaxID=1658671 RepID=UPI00067A3C7D|nr:phosphate acetyltransferase [Arsenicicoccus sp. oral taxon 190]AKT51944.1 phosphate acetyltransferase [Arsenicicoccus sp. oral taxon 190]